MKRLWNLILEGILDQALYALYTTVKQFTSQHSSLHCCHCSMYAMEYGGYWSRLPRSRALCQPGLRRRFFQLHGPQLCLWLCHCLWRGPLSASFWATLLPLLVAIGGCHCWSPLLVAIVGCQCWFPVLVAIVGCQCLSRSVVAQCWFAIVFSKVLFAVFGV